METPPDGYVMHGDLAFPAKYAWIFGHAILATREWVGGS